MALFANITAADLKNGDIIMFAMGSSSPGYVAPRAMFRVSICLRPDVFWGVFGHRRCHKWWLWVLIRRRERVEKEFHVGFNINLP
jgi:hypothetical protein